LRRRAKLVEEEVYAGQVDGRHKKLLAFHGSTRYRPPLHTPTAATVFIQIVAQHVLHLMPIEQGRGRGRLVSLTSGLLAGLALAFARTVPPRS
jgi:hypothetical protein